MLLWKRKGRGVYIQTINSIVDGCFKNVYVQTATIVDGTYKRHVLELVGCTRFAMSRDLSILIVERMPHIAIMCLFNVVLF
jgi:hypothetical protein